MSSPRLLLLLLLLLVAVNWRDKNNIDILVHCGSWKVFFQFPVCLRANGSAHSAEEIDMPLDLLL